MQAYVQQKEDEGAEETPLDWTKAPARRDQKFFENWDFVSLHTLKVEMGIANEMVSHDSNFKVRQLMGDARASVTGGGLFSQRRQNSSAMNSIESVRARRTTSQ
jgi:hypothetical protein